MLLAPAKPVLRIIIRGRNPPDHPLLQLANSFRSQWSYPVLSVRDGREFVTNFVTKSGRFGPENGRNGGGQVDGIMRIRLVYEKKQTIQRNVTALFPTVRFY